MAVISSTPDRITPLKNDIRSPRCTTCGKTFTKQAGNFPASQSPIYACNNHFLPVCKTCIDKLYEHYCAVLGNDEDAIRRICMKFDIYYSKALAESSRKIAVDRSRVHTYISRANLSQFRRKTYDTTIDEESRQVIESVEEVKESGVKILQRTVKFFGVGFSEDEYKFLQDQYDDWTARHECQTKSQEEIFKAICIAQLNIQRANISGDQKKLDTSMKLFQDLLGAAKIKPNQIKGDVISDQQTFGTLIQKWETEKPIPEPDPEFADVDNIRKYIGTFFFGHLCKMIGIKNSYSEEYEKYLKQYSATKPEFSDDAVNEDIFNKLTGDADGQ